MDKAELRKIFEELLAKKDPEEEKPEEQEPEKKVSADVLALADKIGDRIVEAVEKATGTKDKKALKELFTPKGGLQGIRYPDDVSNLSKEDKIVVWFKSLVFKDRDPEANRVFKALVEGTDSQGGYLVPEEFRAEVFRILPDYAVMRRLARVVPMTTDTLNLNTLTARPHAYWVSEYQSKSTTSAEFGRVTLTPHDLVCLLPVTQQLVADANINVVNFIVTLFAEAIAREEDKAFFTGSGSGKPQGIANCSGVKTYNAGGVLDFDDLLEAVYRLPQRVRNSPSAAFVASGKVIKILRKVKDNDGRYIWTPSASSDVTKPLIERIWNYPVYEQNDISEDQLYFGDWKYYLIGDRQTLTVETTREGGDAWRRNSIEIKAVERVDGKCVLGSAFVKVTGIQS